MKKANDNIEPRIGYGVAQTFKDGRRVLYDVCFGYKSDAIKWCLSIKGWGSLDKRWAWRQLKHKYNLRIVKVRMEVIDE